MADSPRPTLRDVARTAGVSLATASRALGPPSSHGVSGDLRRRVEEAAESLGYRPERGGHALLTQEQPRALGLVVHSVADPYLAALTDSVSRQCAHRGLALCLATTGSSFDSAIEAVSLLDRHRVAAMVLASGRWATDAPSPALEDALAHFTLRGGRMATVALPLPGLDSVDIDFAGACDQLAAHLRDRGYRRPLVLTGPPNHSAAIARSSALVSALESVGIGVPHTHRVASDYGRTGAAIALQQALDADLHPDVVVALNDVMALGAMTHARARGLQVPADLAFTGFGDMDMVRDIHPALTTIHAPVADLGVIAVNLALDGPGDGSATVALPVALVVRESTPPRT